MAAANRQAARPQVLHDRRVRVLHERVAHEGRGVLGEPAVLADRLPDLPPLLAADLEVGRAERGREVDDAGAVGERHEVGHDDGVRALDVRVRRLVPQAREVGAADRRDRRPALAEHRSGEARRDEDPVAIALARPRSRRRRRPRRRCSTGSVHGVVVHTSSEVPTRDASAASTMGNRTNDAGVLDRAVAHRHLGVGQRGPAPRAVRRHLVVLHEQPALEQPLQRPPDRLDVRGVHRPVRVAHVDPEADALGEPLELADVALHRRPAQLVELGDPERLDVALAGGADLLLDLDLDRQAVAVPAALAADLVPGHRLVARVDVLERARLDVVDPGASVRGGRALVEDPRAARPRAGRRTARRSRPRPTSRGSPARGRGTTPSPVTGSNAPIGPPAPPVLQLRCEDGRRAGARGPTSLAAPSRAAAAHGPVAPVPPAITGGSRLRLPRRRGAASGRGSGRMPRGRRRRLPPSRLARAAVRPPARVPVIAGTRDGTPPLRDAR